MGACIKLSSVDYLEIALGAGAGTMGMYLFYKLCDKQSDNIAKLVDGFGQINTRLDVHAGFQADTRRLVSDIDDKLDEHMKNANGGS